MLWVFDGWNLWLFDTKPMSNHFQHWQMERIAWCRSLWKESTSLHLTLIKRERELLNTLFWPPLIDHFVEITFFIIKWGRLCKRSLPLSSWLPNQMISLILIFGFLCRSISFIQKYSTAMRLPLSLPLPSSIQHWSRETGLLQGRPLLPTSAFTNIWKKLFSSHVSVFSLIIESSWKMSPDLQSLLIQDSRWVVDSLTLDAVDSSVSFSSRGGCFGWRDTLLPLPWLFKQPTTSCAKKVNLSDKTGKPFNNHQMRKKVNL